MSRRITTRKGFQRCVDGCINVDGERCGIVFNAGRDRFEIDSKHYHATVSNTDEAVQAYCKQHVVGGVTGIKEKSVGKTLFAPFEVGETYHKSIEVAHPISGVIGTANYFKIIYDPKHASYFLLSNEPKLDGGRCSESLMGDFEYSWWLCDAGDDNSLYSINKTESDAHAEPAEEDDEEVCKGPQGTVEDKLDRIIELLEKVVNRFC